MFRIIASVLALSCTALSTVSAVTIDWSLVGNPGNPADTTVMQQDGTTGYGSVPYSYDIGTYDVTNTQYVAFLNSNDPTGADPLGLYNSRMSLEGYGGISYSALAADGSKYSATADNANNPVNSVTWYNAIRFANWLNNGQVPGSTETGAYTLLGGTPTPSNGDTITRNPGATIFLPSENEWYKAAYYSPVTSSYFQYPTSSNTMPNPTTPTATPNSANFSFSGAFALTPVGAYSGTTSPYGAYDMGGNVWQWNETLIRGSIRGERGSAFNGTAGLMLSSIRGGRVATNETINLGFRVAMIPEPSTICLAALGALAVLAAAKSQPNGNARQHVCTIVR